MSHVSSRQYELPKLGPFGDQGKATNNQYHFTQLIVDNRNHLLNRRDRTQVPIYMKSAAPSGRYSQAAMAKPMVQFKYISKERQASEGLLQKIKGFFGSLFNREASLAQGRKHVEPVSQGYVETEDPTLERIPIPLVEIPEESDDLMYQQVSQRPKASLYRSSQYEGSTAIPLTGASSTNLSKKRSYRQFWKADESASDLDQNQILVSQGTSKRLKVNDQSSLQQIDQMNLRFSEMQKDINSSISKLSSQIDFLDKKFDSKIDSLKETIVKEVCQELKGNVMQTWKDGTDRFYNDAKSIVSELSRSPSVASDFSRSRSASKDFIGFQPTVRQNATLSKLNEY